MKKTVVINQSNYIPWKGYFDLINRADEFILYDEMQYTRRDWRNRNKIKTPQGLQWLTIPVITKGKYHQKINQTMISDSSWKTAHWKTIAQNYAKAPFFTTYCEQLELLYHNCHEQLLSRVNHYFLVHICQILGIDTKLSFSANYQLPDSGKTERLVDLCKQAGATHYLSGPSAQEYIETSAFEQAGITLEYMDYSGYPEYDQLYPPFEAYVSVLDLIFNTGPDASKYMLSF